MPVVHVQTRIEVSFAVTEDGIQSRIVNIPAVLSDFSEAGFVEAFRQYEAKRQELLAQVGGQEVPTVSGG